MNQILQTENKKNKGPVEIGKVVKFFAIAIVILGIVLLGLGIYYLITNNPVQDEIIQEVPNVTIERKEDDVLIEINGNVAISKIIYKWNEEEEKTIEGQGSTNISETIELPYGTNTLNLTVIDINGQETKFQKEYIVEENGPIIELALTKDYKIKIAVQDTKGIQYINYAWNNDEPTKIEAETEQQGTIEQIIEIPLGQNTLKVEAVNNEDIISTKELEVKGVKRPTLTFKKEGDNLIIKAEDESGIKVIEYTLNGTPYTLNYGNKKVVEYTQSLPKGESNMEITAQNQDGGITTKKVVITNK